MSSTGLGRKLGELLYMDNPRKQVPQRYQVIPHQGLVNGLYHGHSRFSDGKTPLKRMVLDEAVPLGMDYWGSMDHLDYTGISSHTHQGPWMGNFSDNKNLHRYSVEDLIEDVGSDLPDDQSTTLALGRGAEIDWDPRNVDTVVERASESDFDYRGISVHYDEDGVGVKSPQIVSDSSADEKAQEYLQETLQAIDASEDAGFDVLCHPGRAEEGPLEEGIEPEMYHWILDEISNTDMVYELNSKVHLRYLLNNDVLPSQLETSEDYIQELPAEYEALATYPGQLPEISIGTDTHRAGHSPTHRADYVAMRNLNFPQIEDNHITETQMRLKFAEDILTQLSETRGEEVQPTSILEDKDLPEITVQKQSSNTIKKNSAP